MFEISLVERARRHQANARIRIAFQIHEMAAKILKKTGEPRDLEVAIEIGQGTRHGQTVLKRIART